MNLADLIVYLDQSEDAAARLRLAGDLAARHHSTLIALFFREYTIAQLQQRAVAELGLVSLPEIEGVDRHLQASIDDAEEKLRSLLAVMTRGADTRTEWRSVEGSASSVLIQNARCSDICIIGHHGFTEAGQVDDRFAEKLLFETGCPILFIPATSSCKTLGRRLVIAWNSSRAATRALNDAIPLIERAEATTMLTINPEDFIERHGAIPVRQMVEHLQRHGLSVDAIQLRDVPSSSIADALQAEACSLGADLLVAGAYGSPKLWQDLVGGVTRGLLSRMRLPVLMSH
jgi:nucleotide-binding universal stress UspA family protein